MKIRFLFQRLLTDSVEGTVSTDTSESSAWFKEQAKKLSNYRPERIARQAAANAVARPTVQGEMFLFNYDPKGKETLPYYDRYPIVIILDVTATHMLGLNLHYIPYKERALLMNRLYQRFLNNEEFDETTFFKNISYEKVNSSRNSLRYWKPCIKRYINNNIVGRMVKIHPAEWDIIL